MRQVAAALLVTGTGRTEEPKASRTPAPPDEPSKTPPSPPRPKREAGSPSRVWQPKHARG